MLPSDSFILDSYSQLSCSAGEFQAWHLIVLAVFRVVYKSIGFCMLAHIWKFVLDDCIV